MLPKTERLTKAELDILFKEGKQRNFPLFLLTYMPAEGFAAAALASKKVFPTAVARNAMRRKVYVAIKAAGVCPQAKIAVVCSKRTASANSEELATSIHDAFLFLS